MEVRASWRFVARPAKAAGPALAAFLVTSAGVAAIAQPIDARPEPVPALVHPVSPSVTAATIRVVLPPPTPLAPVARHKSTETMGLSPHRLESVMPVVSAAAVPPAQPAIAPQVSVSMPGLAPPTSATESAPRPTIPPQRMDASQPTSAPQRITAPQPTNAPQRAIAPQRAGVSARLVATTGLNEAEYSAALRTISARPTPKPIPMVDAESRAAVTRMYGADDFAPTGADRTDALQPVRAPTRSLVDTAAPREARPSGTAPIRMQPDEAIGRYRRTAQGLAFEVATTVNGTSVGSVSLLIRDGENISIRLADLLAAVQPAIDPALYQKLSSSQAAQSYMTFNELRAAGIAVRFNDNDRLILGIR